MEAVVPGPSRPILTARPRPPFIEPLVAFLAAILFYVSLYSEVPYHDVARFVAQVSSGRFVWDIGHIFLQPATLLWHKYLGFGETAEASQKHINTFATSVGIGVFYALLQRLGIVWWQRIAATVLVMASASIMILAPTGHMKLLAFPFVNGALYCGLGWERSGRWRDLLLASMLLALAAGFLASCLASAPFFTFAILLASRQRGLSWTESLTRAVLFAGVCGALFVLFACFGLVVFAGQPISLAGLHASVTQKADLMEAHVALAVRLAREVFGTINNFIATPDIGILGRARLTGALPSLRPYAGTLAWQMPPCVATALILAAIYVRAIVRAARGRADWIILAFLCGAQAWALFYSLNDPEHWFQQTVPTVLLFLTLFQTATIARVLPIWAAMTMAFNVWTIALPQISYPLAQYQAQLNHMFSKRDLLIHFAAYPGGPYLGFFNDRDFSVLKLDNLYIENPHPDAFFAAVAREIEATFQRGGRVVVFGVLDPDNWNAPWTFLAPAGMPKAKLFAWFRDHYQIRPLGRIAEIPAWEVVNSAKPGG